MQPLVSLCQVTQVALSQCFIAKCIFSFSCHLPDFVMIPMPLVRISDIHIGTLSSLMNGHINAKHRDHGTSLVLLINSIDLSKHIIVPQTQYSIKANVKLIIHHVPLVFFQTQCFPRLRLPHPVYTLCQMNNLVLICTGEIFLHLFVCAFFVSSLMIDPVHRVAATCVFTLLPLESLYLADRIGNCFMVYVMN